MLNSRFHRLLVVEELEPIRYKRTSVRRYRCRCDCGNEVIVHKPNLLRGSTKSCGCWKKETAGMHSATHRMSNTPEYEVWTGIKKRCLNPKYKEFHLYGGRGIRLCDEWRDFSVFYKDMGPRPTKNHSIDRKDVNGNYCAENCRWATDLEQSQNTRRNIIFEYMGKLLSLSEIARLSGCNYPSLYHFVARKKLPLDQAISLVSSKKPSLNKCPGAAT